MIAAREVTVVNVACPGVAFSFCRWIGCVDDVGVAGVGALVEMLGRVPDGRKPRGGRHRVGSALAVTAFAVLAGAQRTGKSGTRPRTCGKSCWRCRRVPRRRVFGGLEPADEQDQYTGTSSLAGYVTSGSFSGRRSSFVGFRLPGAPRPALVLSTPNRIPSRSHRNTEKQPPTPFLARSLQWNAFGR